jgi:hypothetical protein
MQCGDKIDYNDDMAVAKVQLAPPTMPPLIPVDLRALATQLPDIASMGSLTVNIQANNFTPQHTDNSQIHALAVNTDAQLGHLRNKIQDTFAKGNATITERFALIGGWCQETYKCQMRVGTQF